MRDPIFRPAHFILPFTAAFSLFVASTAPAEQPLSKSTATETPDPWLKPTVDIRARYEYGHQDGLDTSNAGTVRARLGVLTRAISGFQAFGEFEGTLPVDYDSYRAASVHGPPNKTVIADPKSHELNRLWLSFDGLENVFLKVGRQRIILDNARYIGNVGWRQNEQTFDAATLILNPREDLKIFYGYVDRTIRIFGSEPRMLAAQEDFKGTSHLFNVQYTGCPVGTITAYAYLLDLSNRGGDTNSNQSFGAILKGDLPIDPLSYYLEYGFQRDAFNNPLEYSAHYAHAILTAAVCKAAKLNFGYEYLGSDRGVGYNFPLGTNHAFNGFADKFLTTPANGLQDIYVSTTAKLPCETTGKLFYHKFYNDDGASDYGNEVDFVLTKDLGKGLSVLGKYAYYWANDAPFTDTNRFSIEMNFKF